MTLQVREISRVDHLAAIAALPSVSFLQTPAWGEVKREWRAESIGWFDGTTLVGVGLVLYRQAPRVRRYLAYIPEGPALDWAGAVVADTLPDLLDPLVDHVKARGAFGLRMGPTVVTRRWSAATIKAAMADESVHRFEDVEPDVVSPTGTALTRQLAALGWRPPAAGDGFSAGQPRHVFQVPLAGRDKDDLLKGFNQLWRRNVKKADKAGVTVELGTRDDLPAFHELYTETARRDGFTPRRLSYFEGMWQAMTSEDPQRLRLYVARHEGDLVAATTMVRVGVHAWYSYGASSTDKRDVRGSNAIQWRMICDALAADCEVYDLRGVTDTLDEDDPSVGLIRFKIGTGGEAVEYAGEWDLPISKVLYTAFDLYMKRRS
ncbi:MAG TPA: peptidoglycan bridge formation glycyltransferase FemA/FemB family protein [Jiangellaceae bacterium]|nr:peptidoglycan bridge formation glycyltransferase FemA/FemB family protein [Jiangellaceae bacterium]